MNAMESLGFAHFLAHTDAVGKAVLGLLLVLSVASWYLILTKSVRNLLARRRADAFLKRFWDADSVEQAMQLAALASPDDAFAALAQEAQAGAANVRNGRARLAAASGTEEYLVRVLRNRMNKETARVEYGLAVLASAGSVSPYVGLFGTVWAIYHALVSIGLSGQGTLDKVAGPVGEALIMTALGLAVAIPAALAYNLFTRRNKVWLAELDAFAHDLLNLVSVEPESAETSPNARVRPMSAALKPAR
jgi:biopolymer transport protein ExbB